MISLIVAMDRNRVIGIKNRLPWHLPADLKRFKQITTGHHVIMGRKTFESIGKPLPGRVNVVVTRQSDYRAEGCKVVHSLDAAFMVTHGDPEAFVLGGAELYGQALPFADRLYVTEIDTEVRKGDAYFPSINAKAWRLVEDPPAERDEKSGLAFRFRVYSKK